jgi:hypothetical protein
VSAADLMTLDGLLRHNARTVPDKPALIDPATARRSFTHRDIDEGANGLAERLRMLGLAPGAVVALQAANRAETIVALLAILRGGFIAAPIPLLWGDAEASEALGAVDARALIVSADDPNGDSAEMALRVAARTFAIRHVLAFGSETPDGIVPLGALCDDGAPEFPVAGRDARQAALITFETRAEGQMACMRNHGALLVGGAALVLEAGLPRGAAMVGTMLPGSFAVLATTLVPWLLTGGVLALHTPFAREAFAALNTEIAADIAVLPGPLVAALADAGLIGAGPSPAIAAIWRAPELQQTSRPWTGAAPFVDVLAFGEAGIVPLRRRADGEPVPAKTGPIVVPSAAADGMTVARLSRSRAGNLAIAGAMIPQTLPVTKPREAPDAIDTGFPCRAEADGTLTLGGPPPGLVNVGGYRIVLEQLRELIGRAAPQSVLAALPDLLAGQRLAGTGADLDGIRRALAQSGASPLVGAAFRDRGVG